MYDGHEYFSVRLRNRCVPETPPEIRALLNEAATVIDGRDRGFHERIDKLEAAIIAAKVLLEDVMSPNSRAYQDAFARVREAIKEQLVENGHDGKSWSGGWLVPDDDKAADHLLDDIACMATRAAFGIDSKTE